MWCCAKLGVFKVLWGSFGQSLQIDAAGFSCALNTSQISEYVSLHACL